MTFVMWYNCAVCSAETTMVDIAEKEFDLPIRKKFGTKQFEK